MAGNTVAPRGLSRLGHAAPPHRIAHAPHQELALAGALAAALLAGTAVCPAQGPEPGQQLVREVVYNELHDHDAHGYWRYWIHQTIPQGTQLLEVVETAAGPIQRVVLSNGHAVDDQNRRVEEARLEELANSPAEQSTLRQSHAEDEQRVRQIMALLPDAFCFDDAGEQNGIRHLRFRPNPAYQAHSVEARAFHALHGDLWIDTRAKRLRSIEGHLDADVSLGFGLLGRVDKGSWFRMQRRQVSASEWKTDVLEVHVSGRALLFKTIAHETSETRGGFTRLPGNLSLNDSVKLLEQGPPNSPAPQFDPVVLAGGR